MFSLDFSALRKRKVMEATRRSTCTGPTEDFMSTVSVSAPDPLGPKAGMLPGVQLAGSIASAHWKFVVMRMS